MQRRDISAIEIAFYQTTTQEVTLKEVPAGLKKFEEVDGFLFFGFFGEKNALVCKKLKCMYDMMLMDRNFQDSRACTVVGTAHPCLGSMQRPQDILGRTSVSACGYII